MRKLASLSLALLAAAGPWQSGFADNGTPMATPAPSPTPETPARALEQQNKKYLLLESLSQVLNLLESRYVDEKAVSGDVLIEKAIKGMVNGLDPHTVYLPATELKDFQSDTSGRFGGVGIVISHTQGLMEIVEVIPDSPAAKSGVQPGDIIHSIDGTALTPKNIDELLGRIRGLAGSRVVIEVVPQAEAEAAKLKAGPQTYPLTNRKLKTTSHKLQREIIKSPSVTHSKLSSGYVYARISLFQEDTAENLDKALSAYEDESGGKLQGLILDLRGNPGGLFEQAVRVADLFLDSGIIVSTIGREKNAQSVEYASRRNDHPYMPMCILVNEKSASASEIVAGALQDHNRAVILGTPTFGKGSVQQVMQLPNGSGLKMTIARYYTPKGRSIQAKGITPDIPLPLVEKSPGKEGEPTGRKEADLEGHIEASDLPQGLPVEGFASDVEKWPLRLRNDPQLRVAYTYVKSWERFKKN